MKNDKLWGILEERSCKICDAPLRKYRAGGRIIIKAPFGHVKKLHKHSSDYRYTRDGWED